MKNNAMDYTTSAKSVQSLSTGQCNCMAKPGMVGVGKGNEGHGLFRLFNCSRNGRHHFWMRIFNCQCEALYGSIFPLPYFLVI